MPRRGHPRQRLRSRPVSAQPDLQETVAAHRPGLDQAAHRLAVPDQRAELDVAGVGVRVEVQHGDPPGPRLLDHAGRVGPGDRVVAAKDQRDGARPRHRVHRRLQVPDRPRGVAGEHLDVARVVHPQVRQPVGAQRQGRPRSVVREVTGLADVLRPESGAGTVGGPAVERRAEDHHVGAREGGRVGPVAPGHAQEGDVRAELRAVTSHDRTLADVFAERNYATAIRAHQG